MPKSSVNMGYKGGEKGYKIKKGQELSLNTIQTPHEITCQSTSHRGIEDKPPTSLHVRLK